MEFRQTSQGLLAVDFFITESFLPVQPGNDSIRIFCSPSIPQDCLSSCAGFIEQQLAFGSPSSTAAHHAATYGGKYTVHIEFEHLSSPIGLFPLPSWRSVARARFTLLHASPGHAFARRVARLVALKKILLHTNAAISTLGGGHFLCGHLDTAATMARRQLLVAKALGDDMLFARVYMHYVYINLHSGHLDDALRIALRLRRHARGSKDTELLGMATAAAVLIRRLLTIDHTALPEAATEVHAHDGAVVTKASDDFARYRSALTQRRAAGKSPRPA